MTAPQFSTLIDAHTIHPRIADANWLVVDCRFSLDDPMRGRQDFAVGTIPSAVYADLDRDLSGPKVAGVTGRHPLPDPDVLVALFSSWGVTAKHQVVAFDDAGGPFAARLWWLLKWMGHDAVAVLDGGIQAWTAAGYELRPGVATPLCRATFEGAPRWDLRIEAAELEKMLDHPDLHLADARAPERYRGEVEPIDSEGGHISGASNLFWKQNLAHDGRFCEPADLRRRFETWLSGVDPGRSITYCGSGVTACHNLLAMARAGLTMGRLYPGSWSEWITDPRRPRATGDSP
jgi:thiosulfate/3-mercaptopyruvate sulfurtransferase